MLGCFRKITNKPLVHYWSISHKMTLRNKQSRTQSIELVAPMRGMCTICFDSVCQAEAVGQAHKKLQFFLENRKFYKGFPVGCEQLFIKYGRQQNAQTPKSPLLGRCLAVSTIWWFWLFLRPRIVQTDGKERNSCSIHTSQIVRLGASQNHNTLQEPDREGRNYVRQEIIQKNTSRN